MAIRLVRKESQSAQVAKILETEIRSGKIGPNSKLSSTREMAVLFDVSQQVIKSAMDVLAAKKLIVRRPRKGIYVAPSSRDPDQKEIVCLKVGTADFITHYAEKFLAVDNHDATRRLNLTTTSVATANFNERTFTHQLSRLVESQPDCILINIPSLREDQVKECLDLPLPVVFIGDFAGKGFSGLAYNQIVEDTAERAEAAVAKAVELRRSRILCIGGPLEFSYNKAYRRKAKAVAKANGVQFEYAGHTDGEMIPEQVIERRGRLVARIADQLEAADAIVIDGFQKLEWFSQAFQEHGFAFPGGRTVIADGGMHPGCIYVESDYTELARAAMRRIEHVIAHPEDTKRLVLRGLIRRTMRIIG